MSDDYSENVEDWKRKMHVLSERSPIGVTTLAGTADPASRAAAAKLLAPPSGLWQVRARFDDIATPSHDVGTSNRRPPR